MELPTEIVDAVERDAAVIRALAEHLPGEVERDFPGLQVCVLSARCGMEVLRHFGIRSRPLAVRVAVYNGAFMRRSAAEGRLPRDDAEARKWTRETGSYAIGVGYPNDQMYSGPAPRLAGHIVLLTHFKDNPTDDGVLIDTAITQNSRPRRRMVFKPVVAAVPKGFLGGKPFAFHGDQCVFRYEHHPELREWATVPDWCDPIRRDPIIRRTIAKIERELEDGAA
jgi:hypothetical protein